MISTAAVNNVRCLLQNCYKFWLNLQQHILEGIKVLLEELSTLCGCQWSGKHYFISMSFLIHFLIHNFTCHTNRRCFLEYFATFRPARILSHGYEEASSLFIPCAEFPNPGITLGVYFQTSLNLHSTNPFWIHHTPLNKSEKQQLPLGTAALSCRWQLHRLQWNYLRFGLTKESKLLLWATELHMSN